MKKKNENYLQVLAALAFAAVGFLVLNRRKGSSAETTTTYTALDNSDLPLGYRNNNPLNIIKSSIKWQGEVENNTDGKREQFTTMLYGYRAAFVNLHTYFTKYGLNTIAGIISRWSPDNNTQAYIDYVSKRTGIDPDQQLSFGDKTTMCNLVYAMAEFENGITAATEAAGLPDMNLIKQAYDIATA